MGPNCKTTNGGTCISNLNYGNDERCTFRAEAPITVSATTFDIMVSGNDQGDHLIIGGTDYNRNPNQRGNGGGRDDHGKAAVRAGKEGRLCDLCVSCAAVAATFAAAVAAVAAVASRVATVATSTSPIARMPCDRPTSQLVDAIANQERGVPRERRLPARGAARPDGKHPPDAAGIAACGSTRKERSGAAARDECLGRDGRAVWACTHGRRGADGYGGGILNAGYLTLDRCEVIENTAASYGGGLYNEGTMTISGGSIAADNTAYNDPHGRGYALRRRAAQSRQHEHQRRLNRKK